MKISKQEIQDARSPKGGFTRATMASWGVPWPPVKGWKETILAHGIPYDPAKNPLDTPPQAMPTVIDGEPFGCVGELDIDPAKLLRTVISAVISHGQGHILYEFPEVLAFLGARIPQRDEVAHLHGIDERMFEAADKWPNREVPS